MVTKQAVVARVYQRFCVHYFRTVLWRNNLNNCRSLHSYPRPYQAVFHRAVDFQDRVAVFDQSGEHTYRKLLSQSRKLQKNIQDLLKKPKGTQERIAFLTPNDSNYVVTQWACWLSENVAVPLYHQHPQSLLEYYIKDSQSAVLVASRETVEKLQPVSKTTGLPLLVVEDAVAKDGEELNVTKKDLEDWKNLKKKDAQILYTSGTTGSPKGVVVTHHNIFSQAMALLDAWEYSPTDVLLHTLPLHHTHGILNMLVCPLYAGSACFMLQKFDAAEVWRHLIEPDVGVPRPNVYMAVPTIYAKLIEYHDRMLSKSGTRSKEFILETCKQKIRLMVSGSAALPEPVLERWKEITGHTLLERYGMTEIGMALSNPLHGIRKPGFVGTPLTAVQVCIAKMNAYSPVGYDPIVTADKHGAKVTKGLESESGELLIKGPNIFRCYFNRPEATNETFTKDGWFKTGDTAQYSEGSFKILGRTSSDIIKSGGHKISALDVERYLLIHPQIKECAVVGLPDVTWGEKVAAIVCLKDTSQELTLQSLKDWSKQHMAHYMIPTVLQIIEELPRNAMGKINKKELVKQVFPK